jgi:hypothetical protein
MNNVFLIKALKKAVLIMPFILLYLVFNNAVTLNTQIERQNGDIDDQTTTLVIERKKLTKLKKDYADKLAFIEKHKFDLENGKQQIEKILKVIDSSSYFKSSVVAMRTSKKFINVGRYEILIETKFKNFTLQDFEDLLNAEAQRLGKISPLKYIKNNPKSGVIVLFIKGDTE